jgi:hypothetical protein
MAGYMSHKYIDIFFIETWKRKTANFNKGICLKANRGI